MLYLIATVFLMIFSWEYVDKTTRKRDNSQYQFVLFSLNPYRM